MEQAFSRGYFAYYPTFFEHITAMALLIFQEENVDFGVLETGLGGRFDAVTAANSDIIAFTPVSFDHESILGDTLEKIAEEKAGALRENVIAVSSAQAPEVKYVLDKCAKMKRVKLVYDDYIRITTSENLNFETKKYSIQGVRLGLLGDH